MKQTYDNCLNVITAARAALSREGFESLMRETHREPTMEQICARVELERLSLPTSGAPGSSLSAGV